MQLNSASSGPHLADRFAIYYFISGGMEHGDPGHDQRAEPHRPLRRE